MKRIREIVKNMEEAQLGIGYYVLTFVFITFLRNFLEMLSIDEGIMDFLFEMIFHYSFFYIAILFSFILLFRVVLGVSIDKLYKIMVPGFMILLLPPLTDLVMTAGMGFQMTYILPGTHVDLWLRYFTFFGQFDGSGVSPGIKLEIAIVLLATAFYSWFKLKQWWRTVLLVWAMYSVFFLYGITPYVVMWMLEAMGKSVSFINLPHMLLPYYFMALIVIQAVGLLAWHNRPLFMMLIRDIRPLRVSHYVMMLVFGLVYAGSYSQGFIWSAEHVFEFAFIIVAIILAILFSIVTNNIADIEIDSISNIQRPLVRGNISLENYQKLAAPFFVLAIGFAAVVSITAMFIILLFIGNYFIYSMPPLRLKRLPIISKAIIGLNSVIFIMLGFHFVTGSIADFPKSFILNFVLLLTLTVNFIDIKDYEGDKKAGIKTLPVLIGLRPAKIIIGLLMLAAYLYAWYLLNNKWSFDTWTLGVFASLGILQFIVINKKAYNEKWVFATYLISIIAFIAYWKWKAFELTAIL